jgi:hypothetical protein
MTRKFLAAGVLLLCVAAWLPAQRVIFSDDMTNFPTDWTLGTNGAHPDTWTKKTGRWNSSDGSVKCSRRDSLYNDSVNCWMQHSVALAGYPMGVVTFWAWQMSEGGCDSLHFEYSTNGGTSWYKLWSRSGFYTPWRKVTISNIPPTANSIRFRFGSDASANDKGVYVDDVVLYGMDTTGCLVWSDDMTGFPNRWVIREGNSHFWGGDTYRYVSPAKSAQCAGRDTGYYNGMDGRATRIVRLRGSGYNSFNFWLWLDTEVDDDYLDVEYITIYGGSWIRLGRYTDLMNNWKPCNFELPGNADSVRFRFHSDVSNTRQGAYVDDAMVLDFGARAQDMYPVSLDSLVQDADSGAVVTLKATIRNNGVTKVSVPVFLKIGDGNSYRTMAVAESIAPSGTVRVSFPPWTANVRPGIYPVKCSTAFFLDSQTANDVIMDSITVANTDAGVASVSHPVGLEPIGTIIPQATVRNHGNSRLAANVTFKIPLAAYVQILPFPGGLPVRTDTTLAFPAWNAARGIYVGTCSTYMAGDRIRDNNVLTVAFMVGDTGWTLMAQVPPGVKSKQVKDGGCLACTELQDTQYVYALKGNNRCEFYRYNTLSNSWETRDSIPAVGRALRKKTVKKGACMAQYGGKLYAAKGNNSLEFWQYDPNATGYPWRQLADVPSGVKNVREGGGAAAVLVSGTPYVYFLKGSSTWEFYRYNINLDIWEAEAIAPPGMSNKSFRNGSCLAYDETTSRILALKGSYNELFAYDPLTNQWSDRTGLPLVGRAGRKKKVKDGAGMAPNEGLIYALKGGNTREFWVYQTSSDQWYQSSDFPFGAGKAVKGGGAIVFVPDVNALYALKGNNTVEFAKYQLTGKLEGGIMNCEVQSSSFIPHNSDFRLQIAPNPFDGATAITYVLSKPGVVRLKLYDETGKLVGTLASGYRNAGAYSLAFPQLAASSLAARGSRFPSGVYMLKLETGEFQTTEKLIIR